MSISPEESLGTLGRGKMDTKRKGRRTVVDCLVLGRKEDD